MGVVVTDVIRTATRDNFMNIFNISFDGKYKSGGADLTTQELGFNDLPGAVTVVPFPAGQHSFEYDAEEQKLKAMSGGKEASASTDLSDVTCLVMVFGHEPV